MHDDDHQLRVSGLTVELREWHPAAVGQPQGPWKQANRFESDRTNTASV